MKLPIKKKYLIIALLPIIILSVYWLKFQAGINVFDKFSIGNHFPFKYLKSDVIEPQGPLVLLSEDFNEKKIFKTFSSLWMKEKGKVTEGFSLDGMNGSPCLLIESNSAKSWGYSHRKTIKTKQGDRFYMEAFIKMEGDSLHSYLSMVVFDNNKKAFHWARFKSSTYKKGEWIKVAKEFVIADPTISYIKFRLTGKGAGRYFFDDVLFRKIN